MTLNIKGELISLKTPIVMGVLNFTDDSFFDGGKYKDDTAILLRLEQICSEGGKIVDVGAVSTRPNATPIDAGTEFMRIKRCLTLIRQYFPNLIISVDTFRANIAQMAVEEGASIINDISGGEDPNMFDTIAKLKVPYCLTFNTRKEELSSEELIPTMLSYFGEKVEKLKQLGVNDIIIDPGFGFGQTLEQNFFLMNHLEIFKELALPLLVGISRKSMVYKTLKTTPNEALAGTIALNTVALQKGANILRVHDVKAALDTIQIIETLKQNQ